MKKTKIPKVLVVDDDKQNLVQIEAVLKNLNAEIHTTTDAKEAIYLINKSPYALMIFDVHMPEMDGFELAEIIHSGYTNINTPIIFISGVHFDEMSIYKGYRNGAVDYLTKPLNMNILVSKAQVFLKLNTMQIELMEEKAKSVKALEDKKIAIGSISHEIRNPLGTITSIIEAMEYECQNSELLSYLHLIKSSADHMNRLLSDLVDYTKIETGKIYLELMAFNIFEEIEAIEKSYGLQIEASQNTWELSVDQKIPKKLIGDITRYKQILFNLLNNANKFTKKGSIDLKLEIDKKTEQHIWVKTIVSDTGIGMSQEEQNELFTPFSQSNISINRKYGGSGLGLSISKELSKILGGDLLLESQKGKGSTFSFTCKFGL